MGFWYTCKWVGLQLSWQPPGVGSELKSGLGPEVAGSWDHQLSSHEHLSPCLFPPEKFSSNTNSIANISVLACWIFSCIKPSYPLTFARSTAWIIIALSFQVVKHLVFPFIFIHSRNFFWNNKGIANSQIWSFFFKKRRYSYQYKLLVCSGHQH